MDDSLELPSATPFQNIPVHQPEDDDERSSGDEDAGLDWAKLQCVADIPIAARGRSMIRKPRFGVLRPVIPKRGEKEYEPAPGGGSGLQSHVLDRARQAMFDALRATRSTSR
jgi:tRNA-splicing endonuclease subunit Sen54